MVPVLVIALHVTLIHQSCPSKTKGYFVVIIVLEMIVLERWWRYMVTLYNYCCKCLQGASVFREKIAMHEHCLTKCIVKGDYINIQCKAV